MAYLRSGIDGGRQSNSLVRNRVMDIRGDLATGGRLVLSTTEPTVVDGNELGRIDFQAPLDTGGTDAILVAASIYAEADASFSSSVNATELVFATGASETAAEKMRLTSDGSVGIGTATPDMPLHIYSAENNLLHLESTDQDALFKLEDNGTGHFQINNAADTTSIGTNGRGEMMRFESSTGIYLNEDGEDQDFRVESNGNANMLFVDGGNDRVGIGMVPSFLFEVNGKINATGADAGLMTFNYGQTPFNQWNAKGLKDGGSAVDDDDVILEISATIYDGHTYRDIAFIKMEVDGGVGTSDDPGRITFWTTADGAATPTQRGVFSSAGGLSVGTTSTVTTGNIVVDQGIYIGTASGNWQIRSSSSGSGSTTLYIGNASITVSSDERIKENIVNTEIDAMAKLNALRVVDFTWNDPSDLSFNNKNARGKYTGFIAQEVVDVLPFCVNAVRDEETLTPQPNAKNPAIPDILYKEGNEIPEGKAVGDVREEGKPETDALWGMQYEYVVPVLVKAIQELSAKVTTLENA